MFPISAVKLALSLHTLNQDFIGDSNEVVLGIGVMDALDNVVGTKLSVEYCNQLCGGGGEEQTP